METLSSVGSTVVLNTELVTNQETTTIIQGQNELGTEAADDLDPDIEIDDLDSSSLEDLEEDDPVDNVLEQIYKAASQGNKKELSKLIFVKESSKKAESSKAKNKEPLNNSEYKNASKQVPDKGDSDKGSKKQRVKRKAGSSEETVKNSKVAKVGDKKSKESDTQVTLALGRGSSEENESAVTDKATPTSVQVSTSEVRQHIPVYTTPSVSELLEKTAIVKKTIPNISAAASSITAAQSTSPVIKEAVRPLTSILPAVGASNPIPISIASSGIPLFVPGGAPNQHTFLQVAVNSGTQSDNIALPVGNPFVFPGSVQNIPNSGSASNKPPFLLLPSSSLAQPLFFIDKGVPRQLFPVSPAAASVPSVASSGELPKLACKPSAGHNFHGNKTLPSDVKTKLTITGSKIQQSSPCIQLEKSIDFTALERTLATAVDGENNDVKVVVFCNNKPVQSFSVKEKTQTKAVYGQEALSQKFPELIQEVGNIASSTTVCKIPNKLKPAVVTIRKVARQESKQDTELRRDTESDKEKPAESATTAIDPTESTTVGSDLTNGNTSTICSTPVADIKHTEFVNDTVPKNVTSLKCKTRLLTISSETIKHKKDGKNWKVKLVAKSTSPNAKKQVKKRVQNDFSVISATEDAVASGEKETTHSDEHLEHLYTDVVVKTEVVDSEYKDTSVVDDQLEESLGENRLIISEVDNTEASVDDTPDQPKSEVSTEFKCFVCGRGFAKSRYLRKHIQRIHENPKSRRGNVKGGLKVAQKLKKNVAEDNFDVSQGEAAEENRGVQDINQLETASVDISIVKEEPTSDSEANDSFIQSLIDTPSTSAASPTDPLVYTRNLNRIRVDIDEIDNFQFLKSDLPKTEDGKIEPVYVCEQCGKFYRSRKALKEHFMREHDPAPGEEPLYIYIAGNKYQCNICFNYFHSASDLLSHSKTHTGELQSECIICGKVYASVHVLRRHIENLHADIRPRPFQCNLCDYAASNKWHLKEHYRRHTGEQPFQCPVCQKTFSHQGTMNRHCKMKHNIDCTRTSSKNIFSPNNSLLLGPGYMPEMSSIEKIIANMGTEHVVESEDVKTS